MPSLEDFTGLKRQVAKQTPAEMKAAFAAMRASG